MFIYDNTPYGKKRVADIQSGGDWPMGWCKWGIKFIDKTPEEMEIDRLKEKIRPFLALGYDEIDLEALRKVATATPSVRPKPKVAI